jgi:hypothetical protein
VSWLQDQNMGADLAYKIFWVFFESMAIIFGGDGA